MVSFRLSRSRRGSHVAKEESASADAEWRVILREMHPAELVEDRQAQSSNIRIGGDLGARKRAYTQTGCLTVPLQGRLVVARPMRIVNPWR
jgi:hypothetical protein